MERQIGSLEPGKRADVIIVGMSAARQTPMYDPISHLVYVTRGDDVQTTIVNGQVLMRDRKVLTLDRAAILRDTQAWAGKVARRSHVTNQKSRITIAYTRRHLHPVLRPQRDGGLRHDRMTGHQAKPPVLRDRRQRPAPAPSTRTIRRCTGAGRRRTGSRRTAAAPP